MSQTTAAVPLPADAAKLMEQAREAEAALDRVKAIELYDQAFEKAPDHPEVCFRLAYNLDLVGEEERAKSLYEQATAHPPLRVNALINLAVLHEDAGEFGKAERLLKMVTETDPNHARAQLFLKDVVASRGMVVDDDAQKRDDKESTLLDTPVTDFELSVRARNALKKMNIRTLGDLLRISEAELVAYKNFGEASLLEIKSMLSQRGLRLGQALDEQRSAARQQVYEQLKGDADEATLGILEKPVDDLQLSVRARKALDLLNITTIGDLAARTEAELLGIKNFGQTSLDEINERLEANGLKLRELGESFNE